MPRETFGRLTVRGRSPSSNNRRREVVLCSCGALLTVRRDKLTGGKTRSCGCLHADVTGQIGKERCTTHGQTNSVEYRAWYHAKARTGPGAKGAHRRNYYLRGIRMCQEWRDSFPAFLEHVGTRPGPDYSLDRIDNDGHYEPGNVRWATAQQQNLNKRINSPGGN